jgi:hypothetical protein
VAGPQPADLFLQPEAVQQLRREADVVVLLRGDGDRPVLLLLLREGGNVTDKMRMVGEMKRSCLMPSSRLRTAMMMITLWMAVSGRGTGTGPVGMMERGTMERGTMERRMRKTGSGRRYLRNC